MACLSSGIFALGVRGFEKLCFLSQNIHTKRKPAAYFKIRQIAVRPSTRTLQYSHFVSNDAHPGEIERKILSENSHQRLKARCSNPSYAQRRHFSAALDERTSIVDPYALVEEDLKFLHKDIRQELRWNTNQDELYEIATYYFDGQGKAIRPVMAILMGRAINIHLNKRGISEEQRQVAMLAEMIHSASLIHDDVIDQSELRRGKPSVNVLFNHKKVAMAGDFILAVASMMIARLGNNDVTLTLSKVVTDLVQGEFMQLGAKETTNERFDHYLTKTYRKTASLIANGLKAEAMLAGTDNQMVETAFEYGRNVGIAFQLVDDLLDFIASTDTMGKPTAADLKLGLATAPVLFASDKYPELNEMIMRRFEEPGDVEKAFEMVYESKGLEETKILAKKHCEEAVRYVRKLTDSPYQRGLIVITDLILNRMK